MKRLNAIKFSTKELDKDEQKKLMGGVGGVLQLACRCKCDTGVGEWDTYTTDGVCHNAGSKPSEWCEGSATCTPYEKKTEH